MRVNDDFGRRVRVAAAATPWRASPMQGVERRMLDRVGGEVARATSLVRYAPGSAFSPHEHDGGEEFIVLEGVFQDESGDYPAGSYVRNPPTSRHTPRSGPGCTIFVKLWQFDPQDRQPVTLDLHSVNMAADTARPGVSVAVLYEDSRESVRLERWRGGSRHRLVADGGAELLLLAGALQESGEALAPHDWLRLPDGTDTTLRSAEAGATLWIKTRHLRRSRLQYEIGAVTARSAGG